MSGKLTSEWALKWAETYDACTIADAEHYGQLAAALRIAARVLDEGSVEKLARLLEPEIWRWIDEGVRPYQTARAERSIETAQAVITYLKGEGHG